MLIRNLKPNLGIAWIILCIALLIHVIDEALNDFIFIYNPTVTKLKDNFPFIPFPTFTFEGWLTGLLLAIFILFILSIYAFKQGRWITIFSYILGIIMFLNGAGHIVGSIYLKSWLPGVYSSLILLSASAYLLWSASKLKFRTK